MIPCIPSDVINKFQNALTDFDIKKLQEMFVKMNPLLEDPGIQSSIRDFLDQWDKGIMQRLEWEHPVTGSEGPLVIRFIPQLYRLASLKDFFISAVYTMLAVKIDERVVALNVVAPEDMPASRQNFTAQMEILDFLWAKMGSPNITLHAGELSLRLSPVEPMRNRIRDSIEKGHARRIGHGVSIAWEDDLMGLLKKMREQGILVEICLTSNESILGVKGKDHPFLLYRRAGVPVSINTDDEGISRSNLTMEYIKAIQRYDLKYEEVKEIIRNSIEYSFLPGKSLFENRDYNRLLPEFKEVRSQDWQPDEAAKKLMKANPKLNRQVILERAFAAFEKSLHTHLFQEKS
jgi:hypothetical protein